MSPFADAPLGGVPWVLRGIDGGPLPCVVEDQRVVLLDGTRGLTARDVADVACGRGRLEVDLEAVHARLLAGRAVVDATLASGTPTYGLNRGLGPLKDVEVPLELMADFQKFVILTHAAAIGPGLSRVQGKAALVARLATLATGGSGVSTALFDGLLALLQRDVVPVIPADGSVGAADLSQLAAIGLVLVGGGHAWLPGEDRVVPGAQALAAAGLAPVELGPKDGLALVGSNALSVASAALAHRRAEQVASRADDIAAMTLEALDANLSPFDGRALAARPMPGQAVSGGRVRAALADGDLLGGRVPASSVQNAISLRTVPQVHGALVDHLAVLDAMIGVELSAAPDNPYLDVDRATFVSNGNFSITNLAIGLDTLRVALAHVAMLAERRIALLVGQLRSNTPLVTQIELATRATGFVTPVILAQTASALVASIKHGATPVSLTGTTVGDGVEDHNSMAYPAVRATDAALDDLERLLAVEALLAATVLGRRPARVLGRTVGHLVDSITALTGRADTSSADVVAGVTAVLRTERAEDEIAA